MRFGIILAVLVLQMSCTHCAELLVTLKSEAVSSGEQILLSEVAELPQQSDKLGAIPIVRAALPGQSRSVPAADILTAIHKAGDFDVRFKGPNDSKVTAAVQTIGGSEVAEAATLFLKQEIQKDPDQEIQTEISNPPPDLLIRPGRYQFQCDMPEGGIHPGSQTIRLHVMQNGKRVCDSSCSVNCRITCSLAVAAEHLASGEILEVDGFKTIRREVTASELKDRCNPEKLCGLRAKQAISAGQMLTKSQFAQPLLIRRGESVRVVVRRGNLELTSVGQARNDTSLDEPVRLYISDSAAEVVARTTGLREASLDDPMVRK